MAFTGLTANTKKNIQLDAGMLYKNFTIGSDEPGSSAAASKIIGATEGGATFSAVPEVRQISVDGVKGPTKGFEVIDSWTATLTANIKEVTKDTIALALGAVTISSTDISGYNQVTPNADFADSDYLNNIVWVGKITGSASPIMIELSNVLNPNGFSLKVADKSEGNVPVVLTAHYSADALDTVPFKIYTPVVSY